MLWAHGIILLSVTCGTLLALVPRQKDAWIGPARTFALTAALSVVLLHLVPEALEGVGGFAVVAFLLGLFAPGLLGKLGVALWRSQKPGKKKSEIALEASYAGLLLHRVGDGLGLGAFTGEMHLSRGDGGVITALAAHAIPYVAIVVLTFDSVRGRGSALLRALGLAVASMLGVVLAQLVPLERFAAANSWVAALVGGMLLHVVTHDLESQSPVTFGQKSIDFFAAALGILVGVVGNTGHGEEHAPVGPQFGEILWRLTVETGPLLLLGLGVGALISAFGARLPKAIFTPRNRLVDAFKGALFGAPLPLCSCSVLPISSALLARGAAPAFVVAFLLSTPELGVETFWLSFHFLGPRLAFFRIGGAVILSIVAAVALASALPKASRLTDEPSGEVEVGLQGSYFSRFLAAFDELFFHVGAWMVVGLVLAALLDAALPAAAMGNVHSVPLQFLVITLIAVPSYVCAPSATPLAAVLMMKGVAPGAVLIGLLLGPATNVATVIFLRRSFGMRAAWVGLGAVVLMAWVLGGLLTIVGPGPLPDAALGHEPHHGPVWNGLLLVSVVLFLRLLFVEGTRRFVGTLGFGHSHHGHSHDDDSEGEGGGSGHAHGGHAHGGHGGHAHGGHTHGHGGHAH